jgi:hypothetical protein
VLLGNSDRDEGYNWLLYRFSWILHSLLCS